MQGQPPQAQFQQQPMMQQSMMQQPMMIANYGPKPSALLAYVFWFFLGWLGVHHLYMGRGIGIWIVSLITFQGFGFWWFIDLFLIPSSCSRNR
jgi:TM2 domain-containing membrane protein YozV